MTSQLGKQIIAIHILRDISRSKDNQLTEYNMGNTKCGRQTIPRPFSKKSELSIAYLWINSLKFYTVCFYFMPS